MSGTLPVTVIFYRRPHLLAQSLAGIRVYRPATLLAISDGPPPGDSQAAADVRACREELASGVDWPCRIVRIYAESNLGLKARVESGLDEVFRQVPFSIILEEDCVAGPDFFRFVEEMAARWERDERVAAISGNCFLPLSHALPGSYFFSRYPHIWGWATWANRWKRHDVMDGAWPVRGGLGCLWPDMDFRERRYWQRILDRVYGGKLITWDYRWLLSCWKNRWLAVTPAQNLVGNTGFGPGATNTRDADVATGMERLGELEWPLVHPQNPCRDTDADRAVFANHYLRMEGHLSPGRRLWRSFRKRILGGPWTRSSALSPGASFGQDPQP